MATWLRVPAAIPFPRAETNSLAAVLPKTQAGRFVDLYDVYGDHDDYDDYDVVHYYYY